MLLFIVKLMIYPVSSSNSGYSKVNMSILEAYESDFKSVSDELKNDINSIKSGDNDIIRKAENTIIQLNDLIKQMNVEVRSSDTTTRKPLFDRVQQYQRDLSSYKSDLERAKEVSQRSQLIGDKSAGQRQRLLDTNDKINRQNTSILLAQRSVNETAEIGLEINNELVRNREKIVAAQEKTRDFIGLTDSARRLLSSMQRRDVRQKMILVFVAVVLIIAIAVTIYYTQIKKDKSSSSSSSSSSTSSSTSN